MNIRLSSIILALSCISFSTALNASTISRNAIFLAFIFSMYGLFKNREYLTKDCSFYLLIITAIYSCSIILHTEMFSSVLNLPVDENYYNASLRLMMGALVLYYLYFKKDTFTSREWSLSRYIILIGFFYVSFQGIYLHSEKPDSRLEIKTVATTVAYVYAIQSFAAIYVISTFKNRYSLILISLSILLSFYVILLTETRSVILTYPVFIFLWLIKKNLLSYKFILATFPILIIAVAVNHEPFENAFSRVTSTMSELKDYNNNNGNTSLGSRFSLWKSGVHAFEMHPFGQSAEQRLTEVKYYINTHEFQNPEALRAMSSHMHNDLIDTLSLRGLWGATLLLMLLLVFAYILIKETSNLSGAILLFAPYVIYGFTDTLFIDLRCVTVLVMGVPIYLAGRKLV